MHTGSRDVSLPELEVDALASDGGSVNSDAVDDMVPERDEEGVDEEEIHVIAALIKCMHLVATARYGPLRQS